MTAFKRKNEDVDITTKFLTKMVIVGNNNEENGKQQLPSNSPLPPATNTMDRMKQLRSTWEKSLDNAMTDPIADAIYQSFENDAANVPIFEKRLLEEAEKIHAQLSEEIQQAKDLCHHESTVLAELSSQLAKFQKKRHDLLREIDDLDERQRISQGMIAMYQEEASEELDIINEVEEEKKRQVPRLKTTISLYASTTGIKWDFAHPELLSGQVVSFAFCF